MGIKSTDIVFQPTKFGQASYLPGDVVHGTLVLEITGSKSHELSALLVKVRGSAESRWETSNSDGSSDVHTETQWYIREEIPLSEGSGLSLSPGTHRLPFCFRLPDRLPPTKKLKYGKFVYLCKARAVSRGHFAFDGKKEQEFTVLPQRDLRLEPGLRLPLTVEKKAKWSLFGASLGQYHLTVERQGFTAGETINVRLDGSDALLRALADGNRQVRLKRMAVFTAGKSTRVDKKVVSAVKPGRHPSDWYRMQLTVPDEELSIDNDFCRVITVSYYVKISYRRTNLHVPVTIGTVPVGWSSWGTQYAGDAHA